jgi:hypothetical protein
MQHETRSGAPAIAAKLEAARGVLAAHNAEVGQTVLDVADNVPGAQKRLTELRANISTAAREVFEFEEAHAHAAKRDRVTAATAATRMREEQLAEFKKAMVAREKPMARVLELFGEAAKEYGKYSEATLSALVAVPTGTAVPVMMIGPEGLYGPAFGPCERLLLAELYRLAPERQDGIGRFVMSFAKPINEQMRGQPTAIKPGIDELLAADDAIIAEIEGQIKKLNDQAMRAAGMITDDRKDAAA